VTRGEIDPFLGKLVTLTKTNGEQIRGVLESASDGSYYYIKPLPRFDANTFFLEDLPCEK
jgi:hypothetical protein